MDLAARMIGLASDLFGVTVSTGAVDAICQCASNAPTPAHRAAA
jgi:hypothetical protein